MAAPPVGQTLPSVNPAVRPASSPTFESRAALVPKGKTDDLVFALQIHLDVGIRNPRVVAKHLASAVAVVRVDKDAELGRAIVVDRTYATTHRVLTLALEIRDREVAGVAKEQRSSWNKAGRVEVHGIAGAWLAGADKVGVPTVLCTSAGPPCRPPSRSGERRHRASRPSLTSRIGHLCRRAVSRDDIVWPRPSPRPSGAARLLCPSPLCWPVPGSRRGPFPRRS